jgi:hypothetical protein
VAYTDITSIKARLKVASVDIGDDNFITALITRSQAIIDNYTDQHFEAVSATRKFDIPRNPRRLLFDEWLITCTSVTNGNGVLIPSTEYVLEDYNNPPWYALVLKNTTSYFFMPDSAMNAQKCIAIVGTWGWSATAPDDVKEACERLVVQMYQGRYGQNVTTRTVVTPAGVVSTPQAMTDDIKDLLGNYKKIVLSTGTGYR